MPVGTTRSDRIASFVFQRAGRKISNDIKRSEGVIAVFGARKRIQFQDGGDQVRLRRELTENSNVAFRAATAQVDTNQQSNWETAFWNFAHLTGSAVLNEIEEDMNQSEFQISSLVEGMLDNLSHTIVRQVAGGFREVSPGAGAPESLLTMLPAIVPASQTAVFGGITRSSATGWVSQYDVTAADLTAVAGINTLTTFIIGNLVFGAGMTEQPDFGVCDRVPFSSLMSYATNQMRYNTDEKTAALGFRNVKFLDATLIVDPQFTALVITGTIFFINTNYCYIKVLRGPSMKTIGDEPDTLPVTIKPWGDDLDSFNRVALARVSYNFVTNSLRRNGRKAGLT